MTTEVDHADTCGATYTPGPWTVVTTTHATFIHAAADQEFYVAEIYGRDPRIEKENARLISAAPELVEALREAANEIDSLVEETIASVCVLDRHGYDRTTADESDRAEIERIEAIQAKIRAALSKALNTPVSEDHD